MRRTTPWRAVGLTGAVAVIGIGMSNLSAAAASPPSNPSNPSNSAALVDAPGTSRGTTAQRRDPLQWPFARTSIWNTPLGTSASYVPAGIAATGFGIDVDWSVLSSIGGSIRTGELTGAAPIRHALELDVSARYLFFDAATGGTRWPARLADPGAASRYQGTVPALRMGALLALPPSVTAKRLGVRSTAGRKILAALRDYGAYVVDEAGGDAADLCIEHAAAADFARRAGHTLDADPLVRADLARLIPALAVIDDNGASSIGGHGARRDAWAPPFRAGAGAATRTSASGAGSMRVAPSPPASGLHAARVADVEPRSAAPAPALLAVAGAALGLLVLGLWSGRRLLTPARTGGRRR